MTMFKTGNNPQPGTPAADVYYATLGYRLADGTVKMCTADGQAAEFVFADTVKASRGGFGVGLLSPKHSGGIGVPCHAGGAVEQGHEVVVKMVNFTLSDDSVISLAVAIDVDDADVGDIIVGKASLATSADAQDDFGSPSLALELYDLKAQVAVEAPPGP